MKHKIETKKGYVRFSEVVKNSDGTIKKVIPGNFVPGPGHLYFSVCSCGNQGLSVTIEKSETYVHDKKYQADIKSTK